MIHRKRRAHFLEDLRRLGIDLLYRQAQFLTHFLASLGRPVTRFNDFRTLPRFAKRRAHSLTLFFWEFIKAINASWPAASAGHHLTTVWPVMRTARMRRWRGWTIVFAKRRRRATLL